MKKTLFLSFILFTNIVFSQDEVKDHLLKTLQNTIKAAALDTADLKGKKQWYKKHSLTFNTEQNLYENWEQGGVSSLSFSVFYKGFYNYRSKKFKWDNSVEVGYGLLRQDVSGKGIFDKSNSFKKNDDKIELNSILGYKAFDSWNYSGLVNIKSQFDEGYDNNNNLVSSYFTPTVITTSFGLEYKPRYYLSLMNSPLTCRSMIVADQRLALAGKFGMTENGQFINNALGAYIKLFFKKDVFTNVNLLVKLELFYDYSKPLLDTDINIETFVTMKVNKYLSAFFNVQLAMNKDFSTKLQIKERLGISIPINF